MTTEIFNGSCHIATLAKNNEQAFDNWVRVPKEAIEGINTLTCTIDYPLKRSVNFKVKLEKINDIFNDNLVKLYINDIAAQVANKYYSVWKKHNDWFEGHHIGDLFIESMAIDNGELIVEVGS